MTLSAAPEREVVVPIDTTDEGGASSDDYSLSETSVTFGPTETSKTFTFTAADDAEDDDGESVKLTFDSALPAGVSRGSVPETTVSINDDDAPSSLDCQLRLGHVPRRQRAAPTETVTVTLERRPRARGDHPVLHRQRRTRASASSDDYGAARRPASPSTPRRPPSPLTFSAVSDSGSDDDGRERQAQASAAHCPRGCPEGSVPETDRHHQRRRRGAARGPRPSVSAAATYLRRRVGRARSDGHGGDERMHPSASDVVPIPTRRTRAGPAATTTCSRRPASSSAPRTPPRPSPSRRPRTAWTTTERAWIWASGPLPGGSV